jgi:hypothetical protein
VIEGNAEHDMMQGAQGSSAPQFAAAADNGAGEDNYRAKYKAMPLERAKLSGTRMQSVWNTSIAYLDTMPLDDQAGQTKGQDVDGWINKVGLETGAVQPLRGCMCVAEFGHSCGVTAMLLATRHIVFGFEIVRNRFEYSKRLLKGIREKYGKKLNHVELGTIYCLFICIIFTVLFTFYF